MNDNRISTITDHHIVIDEDGELLEINLITDSGRLKISPFAVTAMYTGLDNSCTGIDERIIMFFLSGGERLLFFACVDIADEIYSELNL